MTKIIDISGVEHEVDCIACAIQSGNVTLPVKRITETEYFVAEQDFEYPIEGFVIIASKRHIKSVAELTADEQEDLMAFLIKCRKAMKEVLGIEELTIVQEETSSSSHFHIWLFPWHQNMDKLNKKKISNISEIMKRAKDNVTPEILQKVEDSNTKLANSFS
jgi:diadenosine tetraphosphate (Ap4A) HIT family hydrolase